MIDFFASVTIALIIIMTLVIYLSNLRQARILKQMRLVLEDWYQAKMRDRRESFRAKFSITDGLKWLGEMTNLDIIEQGRKLEHPRAVEYFSADGVRLVISPIDKRKLRSELRAAEGKRRKVSRLVEPLLGYKPRKVQVIERSTRTSHEWFDLEIEEALRILDIDWGELNQLYFYLIAQEPAKQRSNKLSIVYEKVHHWLRSKSSQGMTWIKQRISKVSGS